MLWLDRKYLLLLSGSLRNFKQKSSTLYNFSCLICNDSSKKSTKARGYAIARTDYFSVYCHNCGYSVPFSKFLKDTNQSLYSEYCFEKFQENSSKKEFSPDIIVPPKFNNPVYIELNNSVRCDLLSENHICKQYLISRKIPENYYKILYFTENYNKFVNELYSNNVLELSEDARLIIPFFDEQHKIVAVSGRALDNVKNKLRYVTIKITEGTDRLVYGLERIDKNILVNVCEGPLDSLHISNCIAAGNADLIPIVNQVGLKNVRLIFDNEPYNSNIVKNVDKALNLGYNVIIWPDSWKYKDINEGIIKGETQDTVEKILNENTYSDIIGKMKFNFWKRT